VEMLKFNYGFGLSGSFWEIGIHTYITAIKHTTGPSVEKSTKICF